MAAAPPVDRGRLRGRQQATPVAKDNTRAPPSQPQLENESKIGSPGESQHFNFLELNLVYFLKCSSNYYLLYSIRSISFIVSSNAIPDPELHVNILKCCYDHPLDTTVVAALHIFKTIIGIL